MMTIGRKIQQNRYYSRFDYSFNIIHMSLLYFQIVLPIVAFVIISALISTILIYRYCSCCATKRSNIAHIKALLFRQEAQRGPTDDSVRGSIDFTNAADDDNIWEIPWKKIQIQHDKVLGKGAYATVFRGQLMLIYLSKHIL